MSKKQSKTGILLRKIFKAAAVALILGGAAIVWTSLHDKKDSAPPTEPKVEEKDSTPPVVVQPPIGTLPSEEEKETVPSEKSPLTEGEKNLTLAIFGEETDVSGIFKMVSKCAFETSDMETPDAETIVACSKSAYSQDYSQEKNIDKYGNFLHEMTHIWQWQNPSETFSCSASEKNVYKYTLDPLSRFSSYCDEQQATIISDYARRFLHPVRGNSYYHKDTPQTDLLLQTLVEDRFPAAKKMRLARPAPKSWLANIGLGG